MTTASVEVLASTHSSKAGETALTHKALVDVARCSGLTKCSNDRPKSEIEERILTAQNFAASLRAKHPDSCERGASSRGGWWGFPGDYEVLEPGDMETEATFCGVRATNRQAPISLFL